MAKKKIENQSTNGASADNVNLRSSSSSTSRTNSSSTTTRPQQVITTDKKINPEGRVVKSESKREGGLTPEEMNQRSEMIHQPYKTVLEELNERKKNVPTPDEEIRRNKRQQNAALLLDMTRLFTDITGAAHGGNAYARQRDNIVEKKEAENAALRERYGARIAAIDKEIDKQKGDLNKALTKLYQQRPSRSSSTTYEYPTTTTKTIPETKTTTKTTSNTSTSTSGIAQQQPKSSGARRGYGNMEKDNGDIDFSMRSDSSNNSNGYERVTIPQANVSAFMTAVSDIVNKDERLKGLVDEQIEIMNEDENTKRLPQDVLRGAAILRVIESEQNPSITSLINQYANRPSYGDIGGHYYNPGQPAVNKDGWWSRLWNMGNASDNESWYFKDANGNPQKIDRGKTYETVTLVYDTAKKKYVELNPIRWDGSTALGGTDGLLRYLNDPSNAADIEKIIIREI